MAPLAAGLASPEKTQALSAVVAAASMTIGQD
jgi:hypothetical protein